MASINCNPDDLENCAKTLNLCDKCVDTLSEVCEGMGHGAWRQNTGTCLVCQNIRTRYDELFEKIIDKLTENDDWQTFRVDVVAQTPRGFNENVMTCFQFLRQEFKKEFKRKLGLFIESKGKVFDPVNPELIILYDSGVLSFKGSTIFVEGRYFKLLRNISQAKWICNNCRGLGCIECGYKGRHFIASVEEFIIIPISVLYHADKVIFHAGGREDVDVLVKGSGRPFVVEIVNPTHRSISIKTIEDVVNEYSKGLVEVVINGFVGPNRIEELKKKAETSMKEYSGTIRFFEPVDPSKLARAAAELSGVTIEQRTPWRVKQRRTDKVRYKTIRSLNLEYIDAYNAHFTIVCQGGTYVKEFISGDDGRTKPSVSQILGIRCKCVSLDLMGVEMQND